MRNQRGSGLIEFLVALGILTICTLSAVVYIASTMQGTKMNLDKDFAVQRAISILEELKGIFESKTGNDATLLDGYDDGTGTDPVLTIQDEVIDPDHPVSGNTHDGTRWRFERQISVKKFPSVQSNDVRLVKVRIFAWQDGQKRQLAEVSSVIRTIADSYPPSQVYDVYCLAIENVPGWWVYMANLVPFVENAISDLEARNPGLEFRVHWIRKLGYGRDQQYRPYINDADDSVADIDWVYFYPGKMPAGEAVEYYYVPNNFSAAVSIDGTQQNDYDASSNPWPYALADQYNHAMRYQDEKNLFDDRVAAGVESQETPTWRLLLDEMYMYPERYENAILINVHGELFPFPPVRNYSDPAKEPNTLPGVRVVTHPARLRYDNTDDVELRVYSWLTDPAGSSLDYLAEPISVLIRGASNLPGLTVRAIEGGLDLNPADGSPDAYVSETFDTFNGYTGDMYYDVSVVTEGVLIRLYNSPLRTPCVGGSGCPDGGLPADKRLYGMDYIPTPLSVPVLPDPFGRDLTDAQDRTKNTARWVITLADADLTDNSMITVETRIGNDLGTGTMYPTANQPPNLSRTYVYRGSDTWVFGDGTSANPPHLPLTERFQFVGDPRHMPYADVKDAFDATTNPLGDGYNRFFDDFHNGSGNLASDDNYWPGFAAIKNDGNSTNDGWYTGSGDIEIEVNRGFQMLRDALLKSHAVFTTMTGFSYYYIGIGNEIGYDCANNFCDSIPTSSKPFDGTSGLRYEMSITTAQSGGVKYVKSNESGNPWWSINWLGELYPDDQYALWESDGNLASGSGSGTFIRVRRPGISTNLPTGTSFQNTTRRLTQEGSTTFFSIGSSSSKFHHQFKGGQFGELTGDGFDIANTYNFPVPERAEINRPFNVNLNSSGNVPDHYQDPAYYDGTLTGTAINHFYDHDTTSLLGSSMIKVDGSQDNDHAFIVVNGLAQTNRTGSAFIGRWSFLTLIQGFLAAGTQTGDKRIAQVPRLEITLPNDLTDLADPSSIDIAWTNEWLRWDGRPYTSSYSTSFSEGTNITSFALLYSDDNGKTWKHMQDDSAATPGRRPTDDSLLETGSSYTWATSSSSFPEGTYLVRVEAFLDGRNLHYSYHQRRIFIKR